MRDFFLADQAALEVNEDGRPSGDEAGSAGPARP